MRSIDHSIHEKPCDVSSESSILRHGLQSKTLTRGGHYRCHTAIPRAPLPSDTWHLRNRRCKCVVEPLFFR